MPLPRPRDDPGVTKRKAAQAKILAWATSDRLRAACRIQISIATALVRAAAEAVAPADKLSPPQHSVRFASPRDAMAGRTGRGFPLR